MTHQASSSFAVISDLLVNQFGVDSASIGPEVVITELGLDSLTLMEFFFAAEDAFSLRIPEDRLNPHQAGLTLSAVCEVIDQMRSISN